MKTKISNIENKNNTENPHLLLTISSANILHFQGRLVATKEPTLVCNFYLKSRLFWLDWFFHFHFLFQDPSRTPHRISSHVSLDSSWMWQFLTSSLIFMILIVLRSSSEVFKKCSSTWISLMIFLLALEYGFWWRKRTDA